MKRVLIFLLLAGLPEWTLAAGERSAAGAHILGMASAGVAFNDLWSIVNNPAGIAWIRGPEAGISFENRYMLAQINRQHLVVGVPFKPFVMGISLSNYGNKLYREVMAGLVFSRKFGRQFAAGVKFDWIHLSAGTEYGSKNLVTFEIGLIFKPTGPVSFGLHIVNPVPVRITENLHDYLSTSFNTGLKWDISEKLLLTAEAEKVVQHPLTIRIGTGYKVLNIFEIRAGITTHPWAFTFGAGFAAGKIHIDLSTGYQRSLGFSPAASISYRLNR